MVSTTGRTDAAARAEAAARQREVDMLAALLPEQGRMLEIGGGTGWQARLRRDRGLAVTSVDLRGRDRRAEHHRVIEYDGVELPLRTAAFDCVWSSNVLEHVEDLAPLLQEVARVTRPGGVAIHVVPTPTWRVLNWAGAPFRGPPHPDDPSRGGCDSPHSSPRPTYPFGAPAHRPAATRRGHFRRSRSSQELAAATVAISTRDRGLGRGCRAASG